MTVTGANFVLLLVTVIVTVTGANFVLLLVTVIVTVTKKIRSRSFLVNGLNPSISIRDNKSYEESG